MTTATASHPGNKPTVSLITPDPAADEARRRGLRQMRTVAVGLLVLAACVYVATLGRDGFWGFVNAGAEASMIGAIADWFAVTALFKHPLGLPIPHTALVPKRKDELGKGLEEFVGENFLQEDIIREREDTQAWWKRLYLPAILMGLGVTLRNMVKNLLRPGALRGTTVVTLFYENSTRTAGLSVRMDSLSPPKPPVAIGSVTTPGRTAMKGTFKFLIVEIIAGMGEIVCMVFLRLFCRQALYHAEQCKTSESCTIRKKFSL